MPNRDIEMLVLTTIHNALVEIAGIASGMILAKMPDYEFINKVNGSIEGTPGVNPAQFPSIGMRYYDKVRYSTNTYGENHLVPVGDGTTAIDYQPLGEFCFPISIYLFTNSRLEQMQIGAKIMNEFSQGKFYPLVDDELDDEYVQVEFIGFNDLMTHRPYVKCFDIKCNARTFNEVSGYVVDYIDVGLQASHNSLVVNEFEVEDFSYFMPLPPDEIDEDAIYFQDWNIVPVDLTDMFGGIYERTEDAEDDVGP